MLVNSIFLSLILLVGAGSLLAILIMVIIINEKLNKLNQKINNENKEQDNIVKVFQENEKKRSSEKQKQKTKIGIVFCRNCASQFTSDKNSCPVCGANRR